MHVSLCHSVTNQLSKRHQSRGRPLLVLLVAVLTNVQFLPLSDAIAAVRDPDSPQTGVPGQQPKRTKLKNKNADDADTASAPTPSTTAPAPAPLPAAEPATDVQKQGWSVVISVFRGEEETQAAAVMLGRIRGEGGLPEAYTQKRDEATVIAVGNFPSANGPAETELKRIQSMQVAGKQPYGGAYLAPPPFGAMPGNTPQYNLLQARQQFGKNALYTLQVGVYARDDLAQPTPKDLAEMRAAAEQAAIRLRKEGELAFYYHGPRRSMVTVGVFDSNDFDPQVPQFKSQRLIDAHKRFPNNLYNGEGIREKRKDGTSRIQPSNLVTIPEK